MRTTRSRSRSGRWHRSRSSVPRPVCGTGSAGVDQLRDVAFAAGIDREERAVPFRLGESPGGRGAGGSHRFTGFAASGSTGAAGRPDRSGIKNRPDIQQTVINLDNTKIGLAGSRSQLLPSLDIQGSFQNNSLAGSLNSLWNIPGAGPNADPFLLAATARRWGRSSGATSRITRSGSS